MATLKANRWALSALALLTSVPALAHPGEHGGFGIVEDLVHLLTEPDHLAFIICGAAVLVSVLTLAGLGKPKRAALLEKLRALRKTL